MSNSHNVAERLSKTRMVSSAINRAVNTAILTHKQANHPIPGYSYGRVKWIEPSKIDC
jgi:hypothetical protein